MPADFVANSFPLRATLWFDEFTPVDTAPAIGTVTDTLQVYNLVGFVSAGAVGNTYTSSFWCAAGSYYFKTTGRTFFNDGIVKWYIDDNLLAIDDWYSAGTVRNVVKTTSLTIPNGGYHKLTMVISGKNASSSGFDIHITNVTLANFLPPAVSALVDTAFQYQEVPTRATLLHNEATTSYTNNFVSNSTQKYGGFWQQSSPGLNDLFTFTFFLRKGIYTLNLLGATNSSSGIVTFSTEEAPYTVGTIDLYSAGAVLNVIKSIPLTVTQSGFHWLQGQAASKNGSSSNYNMIITKIWIKQGSD